MLGRQKHRPSQATDTGSSSPPQPLLTIVGDNARLEGKFDIADSIQIECEVGGELVIGEKGVVQANVQTVDAIIQGQYEGNMVATGNVEITATGRVSGNIETDSLVISRGGFFNGNVVKSKEAEVQKGQRPVYLVEDKRLIQQK